MKSSIIELILPNLVDGLFAAVITTVLAGVIIWLIQKKYEKRLKMDSFYQDRLRQEEDEFYSYIKNAKDPYFQMLRSMSMTGDYSDIQSATTNCVSAIQKAYDISEYYRAVLGKYTEKTRNILRLFNDFIDKYQHYYNDTGIDEAKNTELIDLSKTICNEFEAIDRIYFCNK